MAFISYAQNQEDVMLYRALREVEQGFYIDIGAQDPVIDSVTKAFYDRGWHGINIEPNEEYFHKLQSERPHDLNLAIAIGREEGAVSFYEVAHTGLSTTNAEYAQHHMEAGHQVERREVPCTTLDRICVDWGVQTVHFLKIDVEGSERAVLEGFSFDAVRPWLVVVEATEPNSDREVFARWEELLLGRRYRFVYFDGLNRFYVADEHTDLARHFSRPPNPFDEYVSYHLRWAQTKLDEVQSAERNAVINALNYILADVHSLRDAVAQRDRMIAGLREAIAKRDRQLASLQETMDRQLASLQETKDRQIAGLQETMDRQIAGLQETMDRQVTSLQETVAQRGRQLAGLQQELTAARRRVRHMRSSLSWKLTSPLREARRAALRVVGLFYRSKPPPKVATSAFASSDLAVPDQIAAGLTEPARLLYHNLRDAAAFKRQMEKKRSSRENRI
jgi:FkbM family methyltransferase